MQAQGVGRHSLVELLVFWEEGIQSLEDLLGEGEWFVGSGVPTGVDCVVFGFLVNALVVKELAPEFRRVVVRRKGLVRFTERFMRAYWPELMEKVEKDGSLEE